MSLNPKSHYSGLAYCILSASSGKLEITLWGGGVELWVQLVEVKRLLHMSRLRVMCDTSQSRC